MSIEERRVEVGGSSTRYLIAGEGPPLVLLHGIGTSALEWNRTMPALARRRSVYAPDLLQPERGSDHAGYSPASLAGFVAEFMNALGIERASIVGNSLGGLVALRFALSHPSRMDALGLVDSAGLGQEINPVLSSATLPGLGEAAIYWAKTPIGAAQRALVRTPLLLALPSSAPPEWLAEQYRLGLASGFMETTRVALRSHVSPIGQRESEILLEELFRLEMPTLVVWGESDRVVPLHQAHDAVARLRNGSMEILPGCGHLPHIECPNRFAEVLSRFLDG
ncbi:MAG: alpha/beta fold hydrolase [Actinomycetota bacterium]|nr:alpha/beta fold hydrolase [Actinomycetota bacterium]